MSGSRVPTGIDEPRRFARIPIDAARAGYRLARPVGIGPPIFPTSEKIEELRRLAEVDPKAFRRMLVEDLERQIQGKASGNVVGFLSVFEDAKRDHRRRLFGHPDARVFIVSDRLAIVHPGEAA